MVSEGEGKKNVGIVLFSEVELLDFAGPFEVFSVASQKHNNELFNVFTIGEKEEVESINGMTIKPDFQFSNTPNIDVLIIPGGEGSKAAMQDQNFLEWVKKYDADSTFTVSICSGARILGILGLIDEAEYCTHKEVYAHMAKICPNAHPRPDLRYVQAGKYFTSGGISAGIDLSFHLVKILFGDAVVNSTAQYMEYDLNK